METITLSKRITAADIKSAVEDLYSWKEGCFSLIFGYSHTQVLAFVIGWSNGYDEKADPSEYADGTWRLSWKIGMQSFQSAMQCDYDIDWDMPYDKATGEVYDTDEAISKLDDFTALAKRMNKTALEVYKFQLAQDPYPSEEYEDDDNAA